VVQLPRAVTVRYYFLGDGASKRCAAAERAGELNFCTRLRDARLHDL
jgi:hypothetical protein